MGLAETFGKNLKAIREARDLSGDELAQKVGLTRASISAFENAKIAVNLERVEQLAIALECSVADLLHPGQNPTPIVIKPSTSQIVEMIKGALEENEKTKRELESVKLQIQAQRKKIKDNA